MSASVAATIRRLSAPELQKTTSLPAAAATANGASIDLGSTVLGPHADLIEGVVGVEAVGSLADAKTIIVTIQDSADNASFAAIAGVGTLTLTGAGGVGAAAASQRFKFPPGTRRYVRASAAVQSSGGDNTAQHFYLNLYTNC